MTVVKFSLGISNLKRLELVLANMRKGGAIQRKLDEDVLDYCEDYLPWRTGALAEAARGATELGSGRIIYPGPYARYQYFGEVMGPNIPIIPKGATEPIAWFSPKGQKKYLTGRPIHYSTAVNALAGPMWDKRMWADHKGDIIRDLNREVWRIGNK